MKKKWDKIKTGSLTAEASLALPVFLITVLILLKIVDLYRLHAMLTMSLLESAKELSLTAYAVDEEGKETYETLETAACILYAEGKIPEEIRENGTVTLVGSQVKNGWLELRAVYWPKIGNRLIPVQSRGIMACARVHLFCGKTDGDEESASGESEPMVWVTENGSVYHTDASCRYINLSIHAASNSMMKWKRNRDGEKYQPCEQCIGDGITEAEVYYTEYGNRYHNSLSCSGLRRKIHLVSMEQAEGMHQCSKCAAKAA